MGLLAAAGLLQLLDGLRPQQAVPLPRLIVRNSCQQRAS
jgi:hypothetical protein